MNSDIVKAEKFVHLHLVYHFTVPLSKLQKATRFYELGKSWQNVQKSCIIIFWQINFHNIFFGHIKVSKDSSAKYYKNTRGLKKLMEGMKIFLNKRKTRISMVVRSIKISQKMKSKG